MKEYTLSIVGHAEHHIYNVTVNGEKLHQLATSTNRSIWCDSAKTFVVKIDRGLPQAANEAHVWENLEEEDKQYFAPLLAYGEGWVMQKYATLHKVEYWDEPNEEEAEVRDLAEILWAKYDLLDWQDWNQFGIDTETGKLFIHDYGMRGDSD